MSAPKDPIKYLEWKRKITKSSRGRKMPPRSIEHLLKLSIANKGQIPWIKGRKQTKEHIDKRVQSRIRNGTTSRITAPRNSKHYLWIENRTYAIERRRIHSTLEWKNWRESVFKRDNYTCQECGLKGIYLEPHHIIPVRSDWDKLFKLTNGITLCRPCHQKTIWKESNYAVKYSAIVAAH